MVAEFLSLNELCLLRAVSKETRFADLVRYAV